MNSSDTGDSESRKKRENRAWKNVSESREETIFVRKKLIRILRVWKKLRELKSRKMCWTLLADQEIQSLEKGRV
jgi:hypothetical protein